MIYRLAGSRFTLLLITFSILIGTAGMVTNQVEILTTNYQLNFIPTEVEIEENIAILIAAFGVFLEYRRWLLDRIYPDAIPDSVDQFDRYSRDIGVVLILIAIFMESADLLFLALNSWDIEFAGLKYAEVALLFAANLVAIVTVALFGLRTLRG